MTLIRLIKSRKGVTIIAVLFILLAVGGMGIAVSKITQNEQLQAANSVQIQAAYFAARTGIEMAYQRAIDDCGEGQPLVTLSDLDGTYTLPDGNTVTLLYSSPDIIATGSSGNTARTIRYSDIDAVLAASPVSCCDQVTMPPPAFPEEVEFDKDCTSPDGYTNLGTISLAGQNVKHIPPNQVPFCSQYDTQTKYLINKLTMTGGSTLHIYGPSIIYIEELPGNQLEFKAIGTSGIVLHGNVEFWIKGDITYSGDLSYDSDAEFKLMATGCITVTGSADQTLKDACNPSNC